MSNVLYKKGSPAVPGTLGYLSGDPADPPRPAYCLTISEVYPVTETRVVTDTDAYIWVECKKDAVGAVFWYHDSSYALGDPAGDHYHKLISNPNFGHSKTITRLTGATQTINHTTCYPAFPGGRRLVPGRSPQPGEYNLGWNGSARSIDTIDLNGTYTFSVTAPCVGVVTGLNTSDQTASYTDIQHGIYFAGTRYTVIENGATKTSPAAFVSTDVFKVIRHEGTVYYLKNGVLVYTSLTLSPARAAFADTSLYSYGDTINNAALSSKVAAPYSATTFDCAGTLPTLTGYIASGTAADTGLNCDGVLPEMVGSAQGGYIAVSGVIGPITDEIIGSIGDGTHYNLLAGSLGTLDGYVESGLLTPTFIHSNETIGTLEGFSLVSGGANLTSAGVMPALTPYITSGTTGFDCAADLGELTIDVWFDPWPPINTVDATMPSMTVSAEGQVLSAALGRRIYARLSRLTASITASVTTVVRPPVNVYGDSTVTTKLPRMTARAFGAGRIKATLPSLVTASRGASRIKAQLPALTALVSVTAQEDVWVTASLPTMTAALTASAGVTVNIVASAPRMTARALCGATVVASMPAMTADASGTGGTVADVVATLPPMTAAMSGNAGRVAQVLASMPSLSAVSFASQIVAMMPRMRAYLAANDASYTVTDAYACTVSAEARPVTRYTNYPFYSIVRRGGQTLGFGPGGLKVLDGATDAGSDIAWAFGFGPLTTLPGNEYGDGILKGNDGVYLNGRFTGSVTLDVQVDDGPVYSYVKLAAVDTLDTTRFVPGRGLRGFAYRFAFSGIGAMTAYRTEFLQRALARKVRHG